MDAGKKAVNPEPISTVKPLLIIECKAPTIEIDQLKINNKAADVSAKSNIKKFCYGESLLPRSSCTEQMILVKDKMAPKGPYTDMTDRNLWKRILTTTKYDRGLIEANKIISQNLISENENSDVFSDLYQGFINTGSSKIEAIQFSLDLLGIMSNHGPNISHYLSAAVNADQYDKKKLSVPLTTKGNLIARIGSRSKTDKSYFSSAPPGRAGSLGTFSGLNPYVT